MGLPLLKANGLFSRAEDGKLLFFAMPTSRCAYVVPDQHSEDALRTLAKYWGLCEIFSLVILAPILLRSGPVGLLIGFAIFAIFSGIVYQVAIRVLTSGFEVVPHEPINSENHMVSLSSLLRTVADETHASLLWLCEVVSVVPLAGAALMLLNGREVHHFVGAFIAIVFFGSATIAGGYMISMKGRDTDRAAHAFAERRAAAGH